MRLREAVKDHKQALNDLETSKEQTDKKVTQDLIAEKWRGIFGQLKTIGAKKLSLTAKKNCKDAKEQGYKVFITDEYFSNPEDFLKKECAKISENNEMDPRHYSQLDASRVLGFSVPQILPMSKQNSARDMRNELNKEVKEQFNKQRFLPPKIG